jgi:hypothetical protein
MLSARAYGALLAATRCATTRDGNRATGASPTEASSWLSSKKFTSTPRQLSEARISAAYIRFNTARSPNALAPHELDFDCPYGARQRALISSVHTLKLSSVEGPKLVVSATSAASLPRAIRMRPTRGVLLRGSKVYQPSPR